VCFSLLIMPRENQSVNGNRRKIAPFGDEFQEFLLEIVNPFQILRARVQAPQKSPPLHAHRYLHNVSVESNWHQALRQLTLSA
jgi:hypothetical protein